MTSHELGDRGSNNGHCVQTDSAGYPMAY